jgi:hypothetical protein
MVPELFIQAEADYRIQRRLHEAEEYRRARLVPSRASRNELQGDRTRAFVIKAGTTRKAVAMCARRIGWASRGLS